MAAPVPKPKEQRVNRVPPARGEWVDLEPLDEPILREYDPDWATSVSFSEDKDGKLRAEEVPSGCRREMWEAWRNDPVTSQYSQADVAAIEELGRHFYTYGEAPRLRLMDALGLTPKGKRDLRWRTPNEVKTIRKQEQKASVHKLRAVGKGE